jgi:hypothetical protein
MRPSDRPEFVRTLNGLAAIKRVELTPEALSIWWAAMSKWSIEDFKAAASHLVSSCEWMPSPYHFEQLRQAGELTPGEAWELALSGAKLEPGSRAERAARIVGGQYAIRHANVEKELPFIARRFKVAYDELTDVDAVRVALPNITKPDLARLPDFGNLLKKA